MRTNPRDLSESRRRFPRSFYTSGKRFQVYLQLGDRYFAGEMLDRSDFGFAVAVAEEAITQSIPAVNSANLSLDPSPDADTVKGLSVRYIQKLSDKQWRIGISLEDQQMASQVSRLLESQYQLRPVQDDQGLLDPTRIPFNPEDDQYGQRSIERRRQWLKALTGCESHYLMGLSYSPQLIAGNIENFIGWTQVPVGLAGPVRIKGQYVEQHVPLPMATTEGALVSSLTRGAVVCNRAGGIKTAVIRQTMVRAPLFRFDNLDGALNFTHWVKQHHHDIVGIAESGSKRARLERLEPFVFGHTVHLRFYYQTGDASGQNMTTACTYKACEWIKEKIADDRSIQFEDYLIEGNLSGDKKANMQNFLLGRGISVVAECQLPDELIRSSFRTTAKDMARSWQECSVAAAQIGMVGSNCNFANVIAGLFTATGQDIASVHESSAGILQMKERDGDLYVSLSLPSLVIGSVGGGTGLPPQREALTMMGCYGENRVMRLAEVIAAACLSLEISTSGAVSAGEFVQAHERLGRNRIKQPMTMADLNVGFFTKLLDDGREVTRVEHKSLANHFGVASSTLVNKRNHLQGLFAFRLGFAGEQKARQDYVLKLKPTTDDMVTLGMKLAALSGDDRLPGLFKSNVKMFGFDKGEWREITLYQQLKHRLQRWLPHIAGTVIEPDRGLYGVLLEDLSPYLNDHQITDWNLEQIDKALSDWAQFHSEFFENYDDLMETCFVERFDREQLIKAAPLLQELTEINHERFSNIITPSHFERLKRDIRAMGTWLDRIKASPMTLTHNDFNPRNLCWYPDGAKKRLVAYDWELACIQNPQFDIVEFLIYTMPADAGADLWQARLRYYQRELERAVGQTFDESEFLAVFQANARMWGLVRGNLHLLAHSVNPCDYLSRVYGNLEILLNL
jgi:NADP-dependent 3-hydroxy-3-methylglutaryl-CoA reductase